MDANQLVTEQEKQRARSREKNIEEDYEELDSDDENSNKQNSPGSQGNARRPRKAYTITKQRENWTDDEHAKFLEALKLYDRDWKKIEKFIGTKTVIQIRSHAQKYFLKVQKQNTGERIPPPRPKRKTMTSQPNMTNLSDGTTHVVSMPWISAPSEQATSTPYLNNPTTFAHWMASNNLLPAVMSATDLNSSQAIELHRQQQEQLQQAQQYLQQAMAASQRALKGTEQAAPPARPAEVQTPNFFKIYTFLGSLFDPQTTNHAEILNSMSPVDQQTIQLLMSNVSVNIANPQFREHHSQLIEQYRAIYNKQQEMAQQLNALKQ